MPATLPRKGIDVGFGVRRRTGVQVVDRLAFADGVENQPGFTWMSAEKQTEGCNTHLRKTGPEYWKSTLTNVREKSRLEVC